MCFQPDLIAQDNILHGLEVILCANEGELCDCPRGTCDAEPDPQTVGSDDS